MRDQRPVRRVVRLDLTQKRPQLVLECGHSAHITWGQAERPPKEARCSMCPIDDRAR